MDDDLLDLGAQLFGQAVEPILKRKMRELGITDPKQLPHDVAVRTLIEASTEAALFNFPHANVAKLEHGLRSFTDALFAPAMDNVRKIVDRSTDAFDMCVGTDAALVMAAFGVAVAPLDKRTRTLLAEPSTDLKQVAASFAKLKTALVGYNTCEAQFYCLVTDSLSDLKTKLVTEPRLQPVASILGRIGDALPPANGRPFQHFAAVFARNPDDRFETFFLDDPRPTNGSVLFTAGWMDGSEPKGAPNDGYLVIPVALLRGAIEDPQLAFWLTEPKDARRLTVH
jgi:hypothetical protein